VLGNENYIAKDALTPGLRNRLVRLAAFQNPEFYKKQSMRLSTALTPRMISCTEEFPKHIVLPRGCQDELAALLQHYDSTPAIDDQRHPGEQLDVHFDGKLTAIQNHPCIAGVNRQVALVDNGQLSAGECDGLWVAWWENAGVKRDRSTTVRIQHRLAQRAGAAVGSAGDDNCIRLTMWEDCIRGTLPIHRGIGKVGYSSSCSQE